jgi:aminopeptidase N
MRVRCFPSVVPCSHSPVPRCYAYPLLLLLLLVTLPLLPILQPAAQTATTPFEAEAGGRAAALQAALERADGWEGLELRSQTQWDARHYALNLTVTLGLLYPNISGTVEIRGRSLIYDLNHVDLNLWTYPAGQGNLTVDAVRVDGAYASYSHYNNILTVFPQQTYDPGQEFVVAVTYHGQPREQTVGPIGGKFKVGFCYDRHGALLTPIVFTNSYPYYAASWWPCKDVPWDKAEEGVDITITHSTSYKCVANGAYPPTIVNNGNGTTTTAWHHNYAIASYLVCFAFTNYRLMYTHAGSLPVPLYYYPELESSVISGEWSTLIPAALAAYQDEDLFGLYPFDKYGMHHIGKVLGYPYVWSMEHQTISSIYVGNTEAPLVLVHELAHQWWGDWVTPVGWKHLWLSEGFASYAEALWMETQGGYSALLDCMEDKRGDAMGAQGTIIVTDSSDAYEMLDTKLEYKKAPWVLHMARYWTRFNSWEAGHGENDSGFFDVLHAFGDNYGYGTAATGSLVQLFSTLIDSRMEEFFTRWLEGEGYPLYEYSHQVLEPNVLQLRIEQVQATPPFAMPLRVTIERGSRETVPYVTWIYNHAVVDEIFTLNVPNLGSNPTVTLDIDGWVLDTNTAVPWSEEGGLEIEVLGNSLATTGAERSVRIGYAAPGGVPVQVSVYDIEGRRIRSFDAPGQRGVLVWDGKTETGAQVGSGMYLIRVSGGAVTREARVLLIR